MTLLSEPPEPAVGQTPWIVRLLHKLGLGASSGRHSVDAALLAAIPDPIALCDVAYAPDGSIVDFRFRYCNAHFTRQMNCAADELVDRDASLVALRMHLNLMHAVAKVAAGGPSATVHYTDPGLKKSWEATLHRVRPGAFLLVMRDVTTSGQFEERSARQPKKEATSGTPTPVSRRAERDARVPPRPASPPAYRTGGADSVPAESSKAQASGAPGDGGTSTQQAASTGTANGQPEARPPTPAAAPPSQAPAYTDEDRLTFALHAAQMGLWSRNLRTNRFTASKGVDRLLDREGMMDERTPRALFEAMHPDDRSRVAQAMLVANQEGRVPNNEFRVIHRDGSVHWLEVRGGVVRDANGLPAEAVGVAIDITQRKALEAALARANRAHQLLSVGSVAVMRAQTEDELLHAACATLAGPHGYRSASIGYARDDADETVALMACAGEDGAWLAATMPHWGKRLSRNRPIEVAIRESRPEVAHDIAGCAAHEWKEHALSLGFKANAALPLRDGARAFGALSVYAEDAAAFNAEELGLLEELADVIAFGILNLRIRHERDQAVACTLSSGDMLRDNLESSIQAITATIEMRDAYTAGHQRRVGDLASAIGAELGLDAAAVRGLHLAAIVHDVGKVRVPAEILNNPLPLNGPERELLRMHAEFGFNILKDVRLPWPVAEIVYQHHERIDGSGYPRGLKEDAILLEARIIAVADIVESMASPRPYRAALGLKAALDAIAAQRGRGLDARAVDACIALFESGRFAFVRDLPALASS